MRSATGLDKDNIVNVGGVDFITTPPTQQQLKAKRLLKELTPEDNLGKEFSFSLGPGGLKVPMRVVKPWPEYLDQLPTIDEDGDPIEWTQKDRFRYHQDQASMYVSRRKKAGLPLLDYTVGKQGWKPKEVQKMVDSDGDGWYGMEVIPDPPDFSDQFKKIEYLSHIKQAQTQSKYDEFYKKRYGWADEYRTSPLDFDSLNPKYKLLYDKQHEHNVREIEEDGGLSPFENLKKRNQSFRYGQNRAPFV